MDRLIINLPGGVLDVTAAFYGQLMGVIRLASGGSINHLRRLAKKFGRPIKYIIDVGACMGSYAMAYAIAFPEAKILAIEPSKWNFPHLEHNVEKFPSVKCIKCAVFDKDQSVNIAGPTQLQRPELDCSINTGLISMWGQGINFRETVPGKMLDNLVTEQVDWLKIDVEGAEVEVLQGAPDVLLKHRPIVQIEMRPSNQAMANRPAVAPHKILVRHGYKLMSGIDADWIYFPYDYQGA